MRRPPQPIRQSLFEDLLLVHRRLKTEAKKKGNYVNCPFVTYVGQKYASRRVPRIMIVGQATGPGGWEGHPKDTLREQIRIDRKWCDWGIAEQRNDFWRFARALIVKIWGMHDRPEGDDPQWAVDRLVWSNLAKVAIDYANPEEPFASIQRKLNCRLLRYEVKKLRPTVVVITTGFYEEDIVHEVFGEKKWKKRLHGVHSADSPIWFKYHPEYRAWVFWTMHPLYYRGRDRAIAAIARKASQVAPRI